MPVLLQEDLNIKLPDMHKIKQKFEIECINDIESEIQYEIEKKEISDRIKPGQKIAVAVGSRGIHNIDKIVKKIVDCLKQKGASPFIVSAMGSHGGGTSEGQTLILKDYGITESSMGVPVIVNLDVIEIGMTSDNIKVYTDRIASEADMTILVNRVKPHTDFIGEIESGLCKMSVIGLGNHKGCSSIHKAGFENFEKVIKEAAGIVLEKGNIGFGIAIVENAIDETLKIEAVCKEDFFEKDKELLRLARKKMAKIYIPEIDILVVEEIGKNISGNGIDPNIVGRHGPKAYDPEVPKIDKMVVLGLSKETHGNAIGIGTADITVKKVLNEMNFEATYANSIASGDGSSAKIPMVMENEQEAIAVAVKLWKGNDISRLRIVRIKNTMELENIWVSEALLPYVKGNEDLFEMI